MEDVIIMVPQFSCEYLNDYMSMVEDTESPRIFHVWAAIGIVAAALGRRCYFTMGTKKMFANHYVVIVGTPGVRKSTALSIASNVLKKSTGVKIAPDDTAGQRQGLIRAMLRGSKTNPLYVEGVKLAGEDDTLAGITLQQLAGITDEPDDVEMMEVDREDAQSLTATSDEFSRFIGENSSQLLDFLTSCWDGKSYRYELKNEEIVLKKPLLNILGCTTPVSLARAMPKAAAGQGILSRMILVYGARKYKSIPWPKPMPTDMQDKVSELANEIYTSLHGEFTQSPEAEDYASQLYDYPLEISDARFAYYAERRFDHLIKLAMVLAATRLSMRIEKSDYVEAHRILRATERGMPDALGEFGMNPLAALKQGVLEFMRDVMVMSVEELRAHFHRDARSNEFMEVLNDLIKNKQLTLSQNTKGVAFVSATVSRFATDDDMFRMLTQAS